MRERVDLAAGDAALLAALRAGDEATFAALVDAWSPAMLRIARAHVGSRQAAEDVVQDAWLGVVRGLGRFEGRSSLRTWVFTILVNRARTRGSREARTVAWSQLPGAERTGEPDVDPARFGGPADPYPGHWMSAAAPAPWQDDPEGASLSREARQVLEQALDALPARQATVVRLRDVHGLTADEVCDALGVSAPNQRVLLHRGRSRLRAALEDYFRPAGDHV